MPGVGAGGEKIVLDSQRDIAAPVAAHRPASLALQGGRGTRAAPPQQALGEPRSDCATWVMGIGWVGSSNATPCDYAVRSKRHRGGQSDPVRLRRYCCRRCCRRCRRCLRCRRCRQGCRHCRHYCTIAGDGAGDAADYAVNGADVADDATGNVETNIGKNEQKG